MKDTMMHYAKFPYDPDMMLSDGKNCIEQDRACVKMRLADALRERKEATTSDDYAFAGRKLIESACSDRNASVGRRPGCRRIK